MEYKLLNLKFIGNSVTNGKNPLTLDERKKLKEGLELHLSYTQLAKYVGRNKSTLIRESKRLGNADSYDPEKAQEHSEAMRRQKNANISKTVREKHKAVIASRNASQSTHHIRN